MSELDIMLFCILYLFGLCIIIICIVNQDWENVQRCRDNQDRNAETFENIVVSSPPYLHVVDFNHCYDNDFPNSDLPPSYENCALEPQPPSYSSIAIYSPSMNNV